MPPRRQLDLLGEVDASDRHGHRVRLIFEGARVRVDAEGLGAALAAWRAYRQLPRFPGAGTLAGLLVERLDDFEIAVAIRGHTVARLGRGARPGRLPRLVTRLRVEIDYGALLGAWLRRR
jgi:hypothetical protein